MIKTRFIRIDLSTKCQLNCIVCPGTIVGFKDNIGYGFLSFENFKKIIDSNPYIKIIETSNYGEIFLNPEINKIIEYSFKRGIKLYALNGTNFNKVQDSTLENLVKYKFRKITISLDGSDQNIYSIYRRKGNFNNVIENIKKINYYKKKYKSKYPILLWQFILFGHNQHQVSSARELAKKLNMKFYLKENWDPRYSPLNEIKSDQDVKRYEDEKKKITF